MSCPAPPFIFGPLLHQKFGLLSPSTKNSGKHSNTPYVSPREVTPEVDPKVMGFPRYF